MEYKKIESSLIKGIGGLGGIFTTAYGIGNDNLPQ